MLLLQLLVPELLLAPLSCLLLSHEVGLHHALLPGLLGKQVL